MLGVQSVNRPIAVIALDVRVDVRPVFAGVHAVRALETRRLTALVFQMPVKPSVPFVRLLTLGAIEVTSGRGVHCREQTPGVATPPSSFRGHGRHVRQCTQVEDHCKLYGSFLGK